MMLLLLLAAFAGLASAASPVPGTLYGTLLTAEGVFLEKIDPNTGKNTTVAHLAGPHGSLARVSALKNGFYYWSDGSEKIYKWQLSNGHLAATFSLTAGHYAYDLLVDEKLDALYVVEYVRDAARGRKDAKPLFNVVKVDETSGKSSVVIPQFGGGASLMVGVATLRDGATVFTTNMENNVLINGDLHDGKSTNTAVERLYLMDLAWNPRKGDLLGLSPTRTEYEFFDMDPSRARVTARYPIAGMEHGLTSDMVYSAEKNFYFVVMFDTLYVLDTTTHAVYHKVAPFKQGALLVSCEYQG